MSCSQDIADEIADDVISLYESLPRSGKPVGSQFTVLAGIVARVPGLDENFVICLSTGTKCLSNQSGSCEFGATLADSHAEVIARRCFIRYIFQVALHVTHTPAYGDHIYCPLIFDPDANIFHVKSGWEFWLYISDSPCGEAAVYERSISGRSFSGLKSRRVDEGAAPLSNGQEDASGSSVLRVKPGRCDMDSAAVSSSMSCSDKISRWMQLGVQGGLLSGLLNSDMFLNGISVGADAFSSPGQQLRKLSSVLIDRHPHSACPRPPALFITRCRFAGGKCSVEARQYEEEQLLNNIEGINPEPDTSPTPAVDERVSEDWPGLEALKKRVRAEVAANCKKGHCTRLKSGGTGLSWIADVPYDSSKRGRAHKCDVTSRRREVCGGSVEVTIAATGRPQGYVPSKSSRGNQATVGAGKRCIESRVCRRAIAELYLQLVRAIGAIPPHEVSSDLAVSYFDCKRHSIHGKYRQKREEFLSSPLFCGWVVDDPGVTEQFVVPFS